MFGSDYPFWDPSRSLQTLEEAGLDASVAEGIRAANAGRLFGLDGAEGKPSARAGVSR
jgi:predicted TIM-barrel fold metal-dependent hydrolase